MLCNVVFGLRQVLRVAPLNQPPSGWYGSMQPLRNASAASECSEYATDELLSAPGLEGVADRRRNNIRCLVCASSGGYMLSAGTDRRIRLWDLQTPAASAFVEAKSALDGTPSRCGLSEVASGPGIPCMSWQDGQPHGKGRSVSGGGGPGNASTGQAEFRHPSERHEDAITALKVIEPAAGGAAPMILSGSRDGVLKLWH
jgi:WD40 repeat protein